MSEVQKRLQTARRRLDAAQLLHRHEFESDAIDRLYSGVLESARALLLTQDLTPKTHKGIGMKLGQHFRGEVEVGLLTKLCQNREDADYDLREPSSDAVETYLERAEKSVEASARTIGEN